MSDSVSSHADLSHLDNGGNQIAAMHTLLNPKHRLTFKDPTSLADFMTQKLLEMAVYENAKGLPEEQLKMVMILIKNPSRRTQDEL